ncbi:AAA family ATPase [Bradyrhizobium sp. 174]|uniref:AAA family ATPase n=1 Tax=Bradyrhizobium sp. 174 TaxID=2782645 RepID=UPI001FFBB74B|nr:AAA family ATPase [Bradyrhizobium sp. 174]MCK1574130.1 ATP-binding protein [Bradyrhizobium sp. 174]
MDFHVEHTAPAAGSLKRCAVLVPNNWDDWFEFETAFTLTVFDETGQRHEPGYVKIGERGLIGRRAVPGPRVPGFRSPSVPPRSSPSLPASLFSLGQDETYYETLNQLSEDLCLDVLRGMRDIAFDLRLLDEVVGEAVTGTSLLRDVPIANVRGRFHRLAYGDARLTGFNFSYTMGELGGGLPPPTLSFSVKPASSPPTNIHVLIGRNGVGKSRLMQKLAQALLGRAANPDDPFGTLVIEEGADIEASFAGVIFVSFSAFDNFELGAQPSDRVRATQVGLRDYVIASRPAPTKSPHELALDFLVSFSHCRQGLRAERWKTAVETLQSDDLFAEANATALLELDNQIWEGEAARLFTRLSSGHAIVLLTITRLVELVDERTLILLDEPEAHLHPPLLSAFVRSLSDMLVNRNGVAVVATHSPVVLQEVPASCVIKLWRSGLLSKAERLDTETFGENVSVLTREVFELEVTKAGFHRLIAEAVKDPYRTYEEVLALFNWQLGAEAKALAKALVVERDSDPPPS